MSEVVGAVVVLCDGKRVAWKCTVGRDGERMCRDLAPRYFRGTPRSGEHEVRHGNFANMDEAEDWCASFPAHPDEAGFVPRRREVEQ